MTDAHLWWYVARATGLIGWVLLTLSVLWGIVLSTRILGRFHKQAWLQDVHRYLGGLGLLFVGVHLVSLMLDPWLHFSAAEALLPGVATYRTVPVAVGIVGAYAMAAVYATSLMMSRLPRKAWKAVHYLSYVTVLAVAVHAGLTGTDVTTWWYRLIAVTLILSTTVAVITRILAGKRSARASRERTGALIPVSAAPVVRAPDGRLLDVVGLSSPAVGVRSVRLAARDGAPLPAWEPGAHISLQLPSGDMRQYSLCGDPADRGFYDIAVRDGQGAGAEFVHRHLVTGMQVHVTGPANHFQLIPAAKYLFIAGGIGITPIKSMIESLPAHRQWQLLYFGQSLEQMAFADQLKATYGDRVVLIPSSAGMRVDFDKLAAASAGTEVYFCGPERLLAAVAAAVPADQLHYERFSPVSRPPATGQEHSFQVTATRTGRTVEVPADQSTLDALAAAGVTVPNSCGRGVCGTCEVRVLAGQPDHRDSVMPDVEKDKLGIMYPCVSRSLGDHLTLEA